MEFLNFKLEYIKIFKRLQIGNPIHRTDKRIVWIDGGIHAREWAAVHTALYFIDQVYIF